MKKILAIASLLAASSAAHSDELDDLLTASAAIVNQIDYGIQMTGAVMEYAYTGSGLTDGTMSDGAYISTEQLDAYNDALTAMASYQAYGSVQDVLEEQAAAELVLMNNAVDTFTEVVVDMVAVTQVLEDVESASNPTEQAEVQEFVTNNTEALQITQADVDTYNQSVDAIETHANNAAAYTAVAANPDAVAFLQTGAENNNVDASNASLTYDANRQWVKMSWTGTNNASAVYLNGSNFNMPNLYVSEADVLLAGSETEFYLTSPTYLGYKCFVEQIGCEGG